MEHLTIPEGYQSPLTIRETEVAIKEIKDHFEQTKLLSIVYFLDTVFDTTQRKK